MCSSSRRSRSVCYAAQPTTHSHKNTPHNTIPFYSARYTPHRTAPFPSPTSTTQPLPTPHKHTTHHTPFAGLLLQEDRDPAGTALGPQRADREGPFQEVRGPNPFQRGQLHRRSRVCGWRGEMRCCRQSHQSFHHSWFAVHVRGKAEVNCIRGCCGGPDELGGNTTVFGLSTLTILIHASEKPF